MKTRINLFEIVFVTSFLLFILSTNDAGALDIYNIDLQKINTYDVIEKGTSVDLLLLNDIYAEKKQANSKSPVKFKMSTDENLNLKANGTITKSSGGERFSMFSSLQFSTNKLILDDGQEVNFSGISSTLKGVHPPHSNPNSINFTRSIAALSIGTSPVTLGASLGISFLVGGLLSAYKNGITDFVWGGLNGTGFSFLESILRKQPDMYLASGTSVPVTLNEDIKIPQGIKKDKVYFLNLGKEESISKIKELLDRGDITGAIELAAKTRQKEIYDKLIKNISI